MSERRTLRTLAVCQICGLAPGLYVVWNGTPLGHCLRCRVLVRLVDDEGVECPVPPLVAREWRALMARYWQEIGSPIYHRALTFSRGVEYDDDPLGSAPPPLR